MSVRKKGLGKGLAALVEEHIVSPLVEITPDVQQFSSKKDGTLTVSPHNILQIGRAHV